MANYLERVASSAGRRAAIAKPPSSGPPLLPPGRDFSLPFEGLFASDDDQFFEASTQDRRGESAPPDKHVEPAPKVDVGGTPRTTEPRDDLPPQVERETQPRPRQELLSSEPPFTVHLPKTLRPVSPAKVPPPVADEQPRERVPSPVPRHVGPTEFHVGPTEFTVAEEPERIDHRSESEAPRQLEAETTAPPVRPQAPIAGRTDERQPSTVKPIKTEAAATETAPVPRVDHVDGQPTLPRHRAEPLPPPTLPVHLPPADGGTARQEQSRISIGSLEVLVNNHQPSNNVRPPAAAPSRAENLNLEKRYLDRFRLRH